MRLSLARQVAPGCERDEFPCRPDEPVLLVVDAYLGLKMVVSGLGHPLGAFGPSAPRRVVVTRRCHDAVSSSYRSMTPPWWWWCRRRRPLLRSRASAEGRHHVIEREKDRLATTTRHGRLRPLLRSRASAATATTARRSRRSPCARTATRPTRPSRSLSVVARGLYAASARDGSGVVGCAQSGSGSGSGSEVVWWRLLPPTTPRRDTTATPPPHGPPSTSASLSTCELLQRPTGLSSL